MSPFVAAAVVVVGFASGILSGMFGVGGAVLTTPGIRAFGATPIEGVGSTIPAILPGAISGSIRYARAGLVDWRIALTCGALGSAFAVVGANVADIVNARYLLLLTAALLLWSGLRNIRSPRAVPVAAPAGGAPVEPVGDAAPGNPSTPLIGVIGAGSGFLAGLLGVGGGVIMVPAFGALLKLPPKRAVASSLVAVAIFSVPAMVRHAQLGNINWAYALALVVGVVPGAQIGSRLTISGSERRLRLLMGVFFSVLAVTYGISEALAL